MPECDRILLLDDGELSDVAAILDELELPYTRLRGGEVGQKMAPPRDILIATPRRAEAVRRGSPPGSPVGRPVRIIAVEEDSTAMRRMLRRMGFHLLVRLPCEDSIWRLLIRRALYQGDERRCDERVAMGAPVALSETDGEHSRERGATLMDISNRGCRLVGDAPFELGSRITIVLPASATGGAPVTLMGNVARASEEKEEAGLRAVAAVIFDDDMDDDERIALGGVINRWSMGPPSIGTTTHDGPALPPCESREIPGLTLDEETDPPIRVGASVAVQLTGLGGVTDLTAERREYKRGAFGGTVVATRGESHRVLMGRDLSAGGMRIEHLPGLDVGDTFKIALYGPSPLEPFAVEAEIVRDDGEAGLALTFRSVAPEIAVALEKLVACLPEIESLEEEESHGMGAVLSEILDDDEPLG